MKKSSLNHQYRLIWSRVQNAFVAVAEHARSNRKHASTARQSMAVFALASKATFTLLVAAALFSFNQNANAQWTGIEAQHGQFSQQTTGNHLDINVMTQHLVANAQSLSLASHESVNVNQLTGGSALFRSLENSASQIFGRVSSNGSLFLINPNGVLFGQGAQINVGSLVASSMNISNSDFLSGNYQFNAGGSTGHVINQGVIKVVDGGYVALLGNQVVNSGNITANNGSVVMASAGSATLDFYGNGLVKAKLSGDALDAVIQQSGTVQADGGAVQLATSSRSSAVNVSGIIQANSLVERDGVIRLEGGDHAKVSVSGTLNAKGEQAGTTGGNIQVTGEQVALFSGAKVDASGQVGGGEVLVGGDYQGKNDQVYNARTTYIDQNTSINVNAEQAGDAGKAIIWADDTTRYYGDISAKGGAQSGDGGFVEVSGKKNLGFNGTVDVSASNGEGGKVLLDPENIVLNNTTQAAPTNNPNGTPDIAFGDAPDPGTTTVQINDVRGFSELYLQATNDITVANTLSMFNNRSVLLEANNDIHINAEVSTRGTGSITFNADNDINVSGRLNSYGTGAINITADADSSGAGDVAINQRVFARSGGINIKGFNVQNTVAGYVQTQGQVGQQSGDINVTAVNNVSLAGRLLANGRNGSAGVDGAHAGDVTVVAGASLTTANIVTYGGRGGTGNTSGGNAGAISVASTGVGDINTGTLNARSGQARGTGTGGTASSVTVNNADGNIDTKHIYVHGNTNGDGGAINVTATTGDISVTGNVYAQGGTTASGSTANGGAGGSVDFNAAGDVTVTSRIYTQGGGVGSGNTAAGGDGGDINITGNNLAFNNVVYAYGNNARGLNQAGGNAGNINLNATGAITASNNVYAYGGRGGTGAGSNAAGGDAGNIAITSTGAGDITTGNVNARSGQAIGSGAGGATNSITINNTSGGVTATSLNVSGNANGDGGSIDVNASGDVAVTGIVYAQGGNINVGHTAAGRNGGSINIAGNNLTFGNRVYAYGSNARGLNQAGGNAGNINLNATGAITANNLIYAYGGRGGTGVGSNAAGGNAGNITIASTGAGDIATSHINARNGQARGTGAGGATGSINISNAVGNIATKNLDTYGNSNGEGGAIDVVATSGNVNIAGRVYSYGGGVNAGHTLAGRSGGNINIAGVDRTITSRVNAGGGAARGTNQAGGDAGVVAITGTGALSVADVYSRNGNATGSGAGGSVGDIDLSGSSITATKNILANGLRNGDGGTIDLTSTSGDIDVKTLTVNGGTANTNTAGNSAGNITINSAGALTANNITANGNTGNGINQDGGNGGGIDIDAAGAITTLAMNASGGTGGSGAGSNSNGGNAGSIDVRSTAAGDININNTLSMHSGFARGAGNGGAAGGIIINNNDGNITTKNIYAEGYNHGDGSDVTLIAINPSNLSASGDVTVNGQIRAYGDVNASGDRAGADGGDVLIVAGNANVAGTINVNGGRGRGVNQIGGDAGEVRFLTLGAITTQAINANGGNAGSGAGSNAAGGDAGDINLRSVFAGDITTANISARTGYSRGSATATGAGSVNIQNDNGALTTGNITTRGQRRGYGGDVTAVTTGGDIAVGTVDARASNVAASNGGDVTLATTTGDATVPNILTGGRWLVYSGDPRDDTIGAFKSTADFKQYNTNYGGALLNPGNGFVYRFAPVITNTLTGSASKVYDGNTNVNSIAGLTFNQGAAIDGDVITLSPFTSATYDNKNVGIGKTLTSNAITVTSQTNGSTQVYGYQTSAATGNVGEITQKGLTVTAVTDTKVYDRTTTSSGTPTVLGLVGGDTATFSQTFDNKNAGTGKTLSVTGTIADGNGGGNYAVTYVANNTGVITAKGLTVSQTAQNKVYDGSTTATLNAGSLVGVIGGDTVSLTSGTGSFADKHVGTGKAVTVTGSGLSGADAGNYTVTDPTGLTADITAKALTVTAVTDTKVYDGTAASGGTPTVVGLVGGDTSGFSQTFDNKNVGIGKTLTASGMAVDGNGGGNYAVTYVTDSTGVITPKAITVTANPGQSKFLFDPDPAAFTYSSSGLVFGDTLTGALARNPGEAPGGYAINQGSIDAGANYTINYIGNVFTILPETSPENAGGLNPRNTAGLGGLIDPNDLAKSDVEIIETAQTCVAGNALPTSESSKTLILNGGIRFPAGVKPYCN